MQKLCLHVSVGRKRQIKRSLILATVLKVGLLVLISALHVNSSGIRAADTRTSAESALASPSIVGDDRPWYRVRGTGVMTISGPGCCEGINFPGTFEMDYIQDSRGGVEIPRLHTSIADMDIVFNFLIFETHRMKIRCGETHNDRTITGNVDVLGNLTIPSGAASISGGFFETRNLLGECPGTSTNLAAMNNSIFRGLLDPGANLVRLGGMFTTRVEGNDYSLTLEMTGTYVNRPPRARFGVTGRNLEAFAQGGCPAVLNAGNPPESVIEANDPAGLKMFLRSLSYDPDGAWTRADVEVDKWFYARGSAPFDFLAEGREHGPMIFGFGPQHRLVLETSDRLGAATTSNCSFRVVDTTPPVVTPRTSISVAATFRGGALVRDSLPIREFLAGATCRDIVDTSPKLLPPLAAGARVTKTTVFPIGKRSVTFRCRDRFGNIGTAQSTIKVVASK